MLTLEQRQALKAYIAADETLDAFPKNSDGAFAVAAILNLEADPAFTVWKTSVPTSECKTAVSWVEYIGLGVGERDAWKFMLSNGTINAADPNVRQGISVIFKGPQAVDSMTALIAIAKRAASTAEKLFSTGTGTEEVPATMTFEGNLSYQHVLAAWNTQ